MKTDNIVKSCEVSACRQSSFIFPKVLSVSHGNKMKGGMKVPKTCTSSTTSGDQRQQIQHGMCCHRPDSRRGSWRPTGVQDDVQGDFMVAHANTFSVVMEEFGKKYRNLHFLRTYLNKSFCLR